MKTIYLLVTIVVLGLSVSAQTKAAKPDCEINMADFSEIRGLKLGMPELSAAAVINASFKPDSYREYVREAYLIPQGSLDWENVKMVNLESFDAQIFKINIRYTEEWNDVIEFGRNFIPKLGLPLTGWRYNDPGGVSLQCKDFQVILRSIMGSSEVTVVDTRAEAAIKRKVVEAEQERKKTIKP